MPRAKWLTGLTVSALLITSMAPSALAETGYITSKTKIYQQPRTNSVSIVVPKGTEVIIVEYGKGSYDGWVRIENPSNGVTAYVKERYVAEDEDSKDEPPAQEEEEQEPEEEVSKETFPAYVAVDSLPVYKSASTSSSKVTTIDFGREVTVVETRGGWAKIQYGSYKGFAEIEGMSKNPPGDPITAYATEDAYIYKEASTSSGRYATLSTGKSIKVYATNGDWCRVSNNGVIGYMRKSQLSTSQQDAEESGPQDVNQPGYVSVEMMKVYASASTSADVLATLSYGTQVQVLQISADGAWARFEYNGHKGFALRSNLSSSPIFSGGGSTGVPGSGSVLMVDWFTSDIQSIFSPGTYAVITDVDSGISWNVIPRNSTNHADVEPLTLADTEAMRQACADSNGNWTYVRHAVWVTIDGQRYAASIYTEPHGEGQIDDNGYSGHLCVHFVNSRTHGSDKVDPDHQKMILKAYNAG